MNLRILAATFAVGFPCLAGAQEDAASPPSQAPEAPEEVIVTGERYAWDIQRQMQEAEKAVYDTFNRFNDEKRFDVSCSTHKVTGSMFNAQVCVPEFEIEASGAHARGYLDTYRAFLDPHNAGYSPNVSHPPAAAVIARLRPEFQKKMKEVVEEHPEVLEALIQYSELRKRYEGTTQNEAE